MLLQNPYFDQNFFGFFLQLLRRAAALLGGEGLRLASDELQLLVLFAVAASSALVGTFLILKRMAMLANAISHTVLIGIVIAFFLTRGAAGAVISSEGLIDLNVMLFASLMMGLATALLTEFLTRAARLQEDASVGLVFTTLFALGVILVTLLTKNAHIGTEVVMGNVDALHPDDAGLIALVLGGNLFLTALFFKEYQIIAFDAGYARALGFAVPFFNYLLMVQVSATVVGAFRAVGVILVLAFLTGPPLTARLLTDDLKKMVALSMLIGSFAALVGVALSRHILSVYGVALSTGGVVVCTIVLFYSAAVVYSFLPFRYNRTAL